MRTGLLGDERLAKLVAGGDEAAFAELYRRYHQMLYRYCRGIVGTETDAQDALQSTFTAALVALRRSQRDAPLRPWLFRIAHNESISLLRRRRPLQELEEDHGVAERPAAEAAEQRAELALLLSDLRELPDRQRGALVMRELSGLSHEEIAAALGISVGAAKQTVFEARRSLQEFTEGRAMACEQVQRIISDGDGRALRGRRVRAHLRECGSCRAFAHAIPARSQNLMALAPALPAPLALGLFARLTGAAPPHGGGAGSIAAGATGKGLGAAISAKLVGTGAAVIATVALGAGAIHHFAASPRTTAPAADGVAHRVHPSHATAGALSPAPGSLASGHRRAAARGTSTQTGSASLGSPAARPRHNHRHSRASEPGAGTAPGRMGNAGRASAVAGAAGTHGNSASSSAQGTAHGLSQRGATSRRYGTTSHPGTRAPRHRRTGRHGYSSHTRVSSGGRRQQTGATGAGSEQHGSLTSSGSGSRSTATSGTSTTSGTDTTTSTTLSPTALSGASMSGAYDVSGGA